MAANLLGGRLLLKSGAVAPIRPGCGVLAVTLGGLGASCVARLGHWAPAFKGVWEGAWECDSGEGAGGWRATLLSPGASRASKQPVLWWVLVVFRVSRHNLAGSRCG